MRVKRIAIAALLVIACASMVWAQCATETAHGSGTTYNVSCGTPLASWPSSLSPGDNVLFQRGCTYQITGQYNVNGSGTSTNRILIGAYGTGARPVISGANKSPTSAAYGINIQNRSWITIDGLEIRRHYLGIKVENSDRITVRRSKIIEIRSAGIRAHAGSDDFLAEFNEVSDTGSDYAGTPSNAEGFYLGTDPVNTSTEDVVLRPVLRYNTTSNVGTNGTGERIEFKPGTRNGIIEGNLLEGGSHCLHVSHWPTSTFKNAHVIKWNLCRNTVATNGQGFIIKSGAEIFENVLANIEAGSKPGIQIQDNQNQGQVISAHHNTVYNAAGAGINNVGESATNNLVWASGSGNFASNPQFINPSAYDFRIPTGSPADGFGAYEPGEALREVGHTACLDEGTPEAPDLVGHWLFNNNPNDESTANNDGTASGTTYTTSSPLEGTHSLALNAATDFFSVPTTFFNPQAGTLLLSANAAAWAAGEEYFFGCTTIPAFGSRLQLRKDGATGILEVGFGDTNQLIVTGTPILATGTHHRIGLRWAASSPGSTSGIVELWHGRPGTAVNTKVAQATYTGMSAFGACHVGNNGNAATATQGLTNAIVDNVKVWSIALTDTEMLEGQSPDPDPTEDPLDLVSCEIGAVANDQAVCTLSDPINPDYCVPSNFSVEYDDVVQEITHAAASGSFETCTLTMAAPPNSTAVNVDVTYLPTPETLLDITNTVSFPTTGGDGLNQADYRCHEPDQSLNTRWRQDCHTPSPGKITLVTSLENTLGTAKAAQDYELWCSKDGGAAQRISEDCTFGLCLRGDADLVTPHGFGPNVSLVTPTGGITFHTGGSYRSNDTPVNQPSIANDGKIDNLWGLELAAGLAPTVDFSCCQRATGGEALDACTPAPIVVRRGAMVRQ